MREELACGKATIKTLRLLSSGDAAILILKAKSFIRWNVFLYWC